MAQDVQGNVVIARACLSEKITRCCVARVRVAVVRVSSVHPVSHVSRAEDFRGDEDAHYDNDTVVMGASLMA